MPTPQLCSSQLSSQQWRAKRKEKRLPWHPRESSRLSQSPLHKYFRVAQLFPCLCCRTCIGKHPAVGYWPVVLSTWGPSGELRPKGSVCCDCRVGPSPGPAFLKLPSTAPCKIGPAASFQCFIQKARTPGGHLTLSNKKRCDSFSPNQRLCPGGGVRVSLLRRATKVILRSAAPLVGSLALPLK